MAGRKRQSRAQEVEDLLRRRIDGLQNPAGRLPSETEIALNLGVSRVTVREALSSLERKGLILRKHGLGTFVNHDALKILTRLDESIEFGELIRLAGHQSQLSLVQSYTGLIPPSVADRLLATPETLALTVHKVFSADNVPVIYCLNVIPLRAGLESTLRDRVDPAVPVYTLLSEWYGESVAYQIADIDPVQADPEAARHLACAVGDPLLSIEEVGYNSEQQPVFYAHEYYRPGFIKFRLVRKPV